MNWIPFILLATGTLYSAPQPSFTSEKKAEAFKPFTGKVLSNKVRMRSKADLESHIVRQLGKQDLLLITGEEGNFYAIQPPKDLKTYVFRSYILDGVVEADRVNVRLEPHVDATIIGQLQAGTKVAGIPCATNPKWLEIAPPSGTHFYVAKEYVTYAGGPEFLAEMDKRKTQVETLLSSALCLAEMETKKSFEEMSSEEAVSKLQDIVHNYADFPEAVAQAKEALAVLKETYLQKKISHLEDERIAVPLNGAAMAKKQAANSLKSSRINTDDMQYWNVVEESLYLSWAAFHAGKKMEDFYQEQKANGTILSGKVETYKQSVKNKPGDYLLKCDQSPSAYLYSTEVDLEKFVDKEVTILVSPRPNNHFAFPAYFVLAIE